MFSSDFIRLVDFLSCLIRRFESINSPSTPLAASSHPHLSYSRIGVFPEVEEFLVMLYDFGLFAFLIT